ncbi:hypothetical protein EC957_002009 [Mortierella hygrophila]|uniref:DUF1772-domain-containing protein n=1 Tax=Mortierella hygrophila TaxID=979708 RepID=A0A9P6FG04_9FUNG|nr:hypothetical protein EC957_002009 [Mortierella hygrophila]
MPLQTILQSLLSSSTSQIALKTLTVGSIGLFAGQALSYNAIIMPALRTIPPLTALPVWAKSYNTGKSIQVGLIFTSLLAGLPVYYKAGNAFFLMGPLVMGAIIPFTMAFIMPVNRTLLGILDGTEAKTTTGKNGPQISHGKGEGDLNELYVKWDLLHFGRTVMSLAAFGLTLYGSFSRHALTMFQ